MSNGEAHKLLDNNKNGHISRGSSDDEEYDLEVYPPLPIHNGTGNGRAFRWQNSQAAAGAKGVLQKLKTLLFPNKRRGIALTVIILLLFIAGGVWIGRPSKVWEPAHESVTDFHDRIFKEVLEFERDLPQHNLDLPSPQGLNGRYLFFSDHSRGSGWNNILQEALFETYLAEISDRAYVFPPHWARDHRPFAGVNDLYVPFSAFSYSPSTGAPFPGSIDYPGATSSSSSSSESGIPRAVSEEFWKVVCPPERIVKLPVRPTSAELGLKYDEADMWEIMVAWAKKLKEMKEPCVDVSNGTLFWWAMFGTPKILTVWSGLSASPVLKNWDWSPLIHADLERNGFPVPTRSPSALLRKTLPASHPWAFKDASEEGSPRTDADEYDEEYIAGTPQHVIKDTIAIHLRRGDYEGHCRGLSGWEALFNSWNQLGLYSSTDNINPPSHVKTSDYRIVERLINNSYPHIPDTLYSKPYSHRLPHMDNPPVEGEPLTLKQLVMLHCWPTLDGIRDKLALIRKEKPHLNKLYLMTNGKERWIGALIELLKEDGWEENNIKTSLNIELSEAGTAVYQGFDMAIGNWAEAFVGVGFSSLSSNVVGFRLAQGHPADSVYFF